MIYASVYTQSFQSASWGVGSHFALAFRSFHASIKSTATKRRAWSSSEDAKLTEMWERGTSVKEIVASLERSFYSVTQRRNTLGLQSRLRHLSQEEDTRLIESKARGLKWEQIVTLFPGMSLMSLRSRWHRYLSERSLDSKGSIRKGQLYTSDEDKQLLQLRNEQKLGWTEIQKCIPERRTWSLTNRYNRLMGDAPRPAVKHVLKSSHYLTKIQTLIAEGRTTREIALQTGLSNSWVGKLKSMLKAPTNKTKSYRAWTDAEVEQARLLKHGGKDYVEIATQLERSYESVAQLFRRLKHSKKYMALRKEVEKPPK